MRLDPEDKHQGHLSAHDSRAKERNPNRSSSSNNGLKNSYNDHRSCVADPSMRPLRMDTFRTGILPKIEEMRASNRWKWGSQVFKSLLVLPAAVIFILCVLLSIAAWLHWAGTLTPVWIEKRLRVGTDIGSRVICDVPGMSNICLLVCPWDQYPSIFPSLCMAEDEPASFDDIVYDMYSNYSQILVFQKKMNLAPLKLRRYRNAIALHRDRIRDLHMRGEVKNVDFGLLEQRLERTFDLVDDVVEDLFLFVNYVKYLPDFVLSWIEQTKARVLKNESEVYRSMIGIRRTKTPQERVRVGLEELTREWKLMIEWMTERKNPGVTTVNSLKDDCLSLRGPIEMVVNRMMEQKRNETSSWPLYKRLALHYGLIKPQFILDQLLRLNALAEVNDLYDLIGHHPDFFTNLASNMKAINSSLENMVESLREGKKSLKWSGNPTEERLVSLVDKLELSAKAIREAK